MRSIGSTDHRPALLQRKGSEMNSSKLAAAASHYKSFCEALGIPMNTDHSVDTPMRVARMFHNDFLVGVREECPKITTFPVDSMLRDQLVIQCGIRLRSLCSHHHVPIVGRAHVCYIPGESLLGLSKIARIVRWCAARPCVQEELVHLIKDTIKSAINPTFIGISVTAEHECMSCRGVTEPDSLTTTNVFWPSHNEDTRQEFFLAISHWLQARGANR
ncbi:MAG: GTP cyclohydrolase I FolE [Candidatus Altiarchaeales archaeon]|nr:GTP cyclohydrolase I FolE [Candidatus Altiarchaeales archaeon]